MALPNVAPLLAKEFVLLKLDYDRQADAPAIQKRYTDQSQGLPWFVFVDGDGKGVITSTGPKGNVGHPFEPHEVAYFREMLQKVKRHLTDAEIDALIKSLEDTNRAK